MSQQFKVGDKVRCIRPDHSGNRLNSSDMYTVMRIEPSIIEPLSIVNFGTSHWWHSDRFELISLVVHFHDELFNI